MVVVDLSVMDLGDGFEALGFVDVGLGEVISAPLRISLTLCMG